MKKYLNDKQNLKICIIGLGYVGLPLAIEFGKKLPTIGFDLKKSRIKSLKLNFDANNEVNKKSFKSSRFLTFSSNHNEIINSNFYIVCVPTPVNSKNIPDLTLIKNACLLLAKVIKKNDYIVFESTVYPGTTEEFCVPIIQKEFSRINKVKIEKNYFNYGYSPERINPGDKKNNISNVYKIVSGSNYKNLKKISKVYSMVAQKIYEAKSIKVAESAKIIENCQRDINIAFMNELTLLFSNLKINFSEVLKAASTKWNFINFKPGLVGGHCIGVDPYYLAHKSKIEGYTPKIILSGRKINDQMAKFYGKKIKFLIKKKINTKKKIQVLILGISFKENVNDTRNSKVFEIIDFLRKDFNVKINDPLVKKNQIKSKYRNLFVNKLIEKSYDAIIFTVPHREYLKKTFQSKIKKIAKKNFLIFDIKNSIDEKFFKKNLIKF